MKEETKERLVTYGPIILILLAFAGYGAFGIWRDYYLNFYVNQIKAMGGWNDFQAWRTSPLALPPDALAAPPYRRETVEAAARFVKAATESQTSGALRYNGEFGRRMPKQTIRDAMLDRAFRFPEEKRKQLQPLFESVHEMVRQPDYELNAIHSGDPSDPANLFQLYPFQNVNLHEIAMLLAFRAAPAIKDGRPEEALESTKDIFLFGKFDVYGSVIHRAVGPNIQETGIEIWEHAVMNCADAAPLRASLARQNEIARELAKGGGNWPIHVYDSLGRLRQFKREGIEILFAAGSAMDLQREVVRVQLEYLKRTGRRDPTANRRTPHPFAGPVKSLQAQYEFLGPARGGILGPISRARQLNQQAAVFLMTYSSSVPSQTGTMLQGPELVRIRMDLLRLLTAHRLYTMEHGAEPASAEVLAPEYLPEIPLDPYAKNGEGYRHLAGPHYYSIGEDGVDDGGIWHDSRNGGVAKQAGDIVPFTWNLSARPESSEGDEDSRF